MTRGDRAGLGGRTPQRRTKLSRIGNSNQRRTPINGDRPRNCYKEQQQRKCGRNRRQIDIEAELFNENITRHAHVGIKNGRIETGSFRMVEVIESAVAYVHAGCRLVPIRTVMHVNATDPHDHQGNAGEPNEQFGVG
jgi:hypothetical protein